MSLGTVKIGETIYPIERIALEHAGIVIHWTVMGPASIEDDRWFLFGADGHLIMRSGGRGRIGSPGPGERWDFHWRLSVTDKQADEQPGGEMPMEVASE